jgi:hypothetical protein
MTARRRPTPALASEDAQEREDSERVDLIARAMSEGRWGQDMAQDLAARWGISIWSLRKLSAEASGKLRASLDMSELATSLVGRLERTYAAAMTAEDYRGAVAALRVLADVAGIGAKTKIEERAPLPKGPAERELPPEYARMMESIELTRFYATHGRLPRPDQEAELLDGRRHPGDPCGHPSCSFCPRVYPPESAGLSHHQRPRSPGNVPHGAERLNTEKTSARKFDVSATENDNIDNDSKGLVSAPKLRFLPAAGRRRAPASTPPRWSALGAVSRVDGATSGAFLRGR